ncbi:hypothetical protein BH09BAC3_BH09BAC3_12840 [soil metagenome]
MNFIDIHSHPSLKMWFFRKKIYKRSEPTCKKFSANMWVNLPMMKQGKVNAAAAVHYLPEVAVKGEMLDTVGTWLLYHVIWLISLGRLRRKLEDKSTPTAPFKQIKQYIKMFEDGIGQARTEGFDVEVAKGLGQFKDGIAAGRIEFIHCTEGLHCLGTKDIKLDTAKEHLKWLFDEGIAQITVAHFFENVIVSSAGGIPPKLARTLGYDPERTYPNGYNPVFGEEIIDYILELGMVIDVVHCPKETIDMIFARNKKRVQQRPLVFAHTGVFEVATGKNPNMPIRDAKSLPTTLDIQRIKDCQGVIGIIFMRYWLCGTEDTEPAINDVMDTIEFIVRVCGDFDNIAIGSDLDGFTEVPDDLAGIETIPGLLNEMRKRNITEENIEKMAFGNYQRVLELGWGKP